MYPRGTVARNVTLSIVKYGTAVSNAYRVFCRDAGVALKPTLSEYRRKPASSFTVTGCIDVSREPLFSRSGRTISVISTPPRFGVVLFRKKRADSRAFNTSNARW